MRREPRTCCLIGFLVMLLMTTVPHLAGGQIPKATRSSPTPPADTRPAKAAAGSASHTPKTPLNTLRADLEAIKPGVQITEALHMNLFHSLLGVAEGPRKPEQQLIKKLTEDLVPALSVSRMTKLEKSALAKDLQEVINSAKVKESQVEVALNDARAVLGATGVAPRDVEAILADMQVLKAEGQKASPAIKSPKGKEPAKRGGRTTGTEKKRR